jgi:hypothetical protein
MRKFVLSEKVLIAQSGQNPHFWSMETSEKHTKCPEHLELPEPALRTILTIRIVMAVLILVPMILVWLRGGFCF